MSDFTFTVNELAGMRETQRDHMMDTCVILSYSSGTPNEYNEADAPVYTEGSPLECGLDMGAGSRRFGQDMTPILYDAVLRLPMETAIKETDQVKIISRFDLFPEPLTYRIVSPIERGPSGLRILLRKVVT